MKLIKMSLVASTIVLFTACGAVDDLVESFDPGDDDYVTTSFTGQFVDTYVKGLNYTCTGPLNGEENQLTGSGVTNDKGEFTCNEGNLVEFSLGSYAIGSDHAWDNPIKSPYDLSLGSQEAIINLAQLLQTLDDHTIDGVLTIPEDYTGLNDVSIKLDDPDFDALMADALNVNSLVSEEVAQAHLDETLASLAPETTPAPAGDETELMLSLAGKTVYIPFDDEGGQNIGIWIFSADGTQLTWIEETTATESISFGGNIITVDNGDGTFTTIEATYIGTSSIDVTFTDGSQVEYLTLYFDRADAEATFSSSI